jgi:hypothetical protein
MPTQKGKSNRLEAREIVESLSLTNSKAKPHITNTAQAMLIAGNDPANVKQWLLVICLALSSEKEKRHLTAKKRV